MLIKIDTSVVNYIKLNIDNLTESSNEIAALNNLALSSKHGTHFIFASLPVLEYLMKLELLDLSSRKTYNSIFSKFSVLGSYQSLFNSYLVVNDNTSEFNREETDSHKIYHAPISYFTHISSIGHTNFLCEDISDFHFYDKLAKKYIKEHHSTFNMALKFDFINGGGDRSGLNYELLLAKNKLSLAIADSDRKIPNGEVGNTLKALKSVFEKYKNVNVTELIGLTVREKENLIPPSLYELCSNSSLDEIIDKFLMIEKSEIHFEKLFYLDIKDGLQVKKLKDKKQREYLEDMFAEIPGLISCAIEDLTSLDDEYYILRGIGTKLMDNFVTNVLDDGLDKQLKTKKKLSSLDPMIIAMLEDKIAKKDNLFTEIPEFIKPQIVELCKTIIAWGCSTTQPNSIAG